jgi:uncharacterized protein YjbJ (UPF0337 family)
LSKTHEVTLAVARVRPKKEEEESRMAAADKAKNTAQTSKGKVKEAAGKVTGNDKLRAKGKADQTKGNLKQAGEKLKDAIKKK